MRPENIQVHFLVTWIGNINTSIKLTEALIQRDYDFVVNYGVCGYKEEKVNLIQVVRSFHLGSSKEIWVPLFFEFVPLASLACSDTPVYDSDILWSESYVDMESYAIEKVCDYFQVPRIILKVPVDKIGEETFNFDIAKAKTKLEQNIDFDTLFTGINTYLSRLPQKLDIEQYYWDYNFTVTETILLEKYISKYETLSSESFQIFFSKHKTLEKKVFLSKLTETLENLSQLW